MKLDRPKYKNYEPEEFPTEKDGFDVVELKYDGWWAQVVLEGREWSVYSRTGELKRWGTLRRAYKRTVIHGEWVFGTEWAQQHLEYQDQIAAFGMTELEGEDITDWPGSRMRFVLSKLLFQLSEEDILGGLFLVQQYGLSQAVRLWELNEEFEGLVFKNSGAPWGARFGRMKRAVEMDYVCIGFEEALQGKFEGNGVASIHGGLVFAGDVAPILACRVSGLTDEQRREFYTNPNKYMGLVFTAKGKRITAKGALRHPNFVRWREDKVLEDCTWEGKRP